MSGIGDASDWIALDELGWRPGARFLATDDQCEHVRMYIIVGNTFAPLYGPVLYNDVMCLRIEIRFPRE